MSRRRPTISSAAASLVVMVAAIAGCGESSESPPQTAFAAALASVGGEGAHGSLGVGWAEPRLVAEIGGAPKLIGDALGPNADSVVEVAGALRRRYGFEPRAAERLVSVGGSYAFGLRLDGVGAPTLRDALLDAGGRDGDAGGLDLVEIGDYAQVPEPLLAIGVSGLGAFDAFGDKRTVLAISETARAALLGRGERLLSEPIYAAAADCLGDVVAARTVPAKLLLSTELGFDAVAVGAAAGRDVLCVLGGESARTSEIASTLEDSLELGAREPRTGTPIGELISDAEVSESTERGIEVVRAELTPAPGRDPGFIFETISSGSLVGLINGPWES